MPIKFHLPDQRRMTQWEQRKKNKLRAMVAIIQITVQEALPLLTNRTIRMETCLPTRVTHLPMKVTHLPMKVTRPPARVIHLPMRVTHLLMRSRMTKRRRSMSCRNFILRPGRFQRNLRWEGS
ncbi:MAG: hypothetical protein BAA01_16560 [Bacillus thermozeamaize]|uniref:Uncharacterized protein n=1 Tax=Bacillus thermozeamaize TaxID=230954 RepID=A0A1Y3PI54_9BACI|nr:MAG: hypothetical protein BAA01_16560 [Bacillus thermozeamaize]